MGAQQDEIGLLYLALARLFDKPEEAVKLMSDIISLSEALGVTGFAEFFTETSTLDLETHRVEMFELTPRCPPYGGYYALGEDSRERGWYMHQVLTYYKAFGYGIDVGRELPDYLPVMLEFLSVTRGVDNPIQRAMRLDFYNRFLKPWLGKFIECVEKTGSPYRHLLSALRQLLNLDFETTPQLLKHFLHQSSENVTRPQAVADL